MAANTSPLEDFLFLVEWGGARTGMLKVGPLKWSTSVVSHRDGSNPLNSPLMAPGLTTYEPITLEREIVSGDLDFQTWASQVVNAAGGGAGGSGYHRDVVITLLDGQRNPAVVFKVRNCWPSAYEAIVELNADASGVAIERLTVQYESLVRADP